MQTHRSSRREIPLPVQPQAEITGKADRSKTMWFAGSGKATSLAATLGEFYGSIEIEGGIAMNAVAASIEVAPTPSEQRMLLHGIAWKEYVILRELIDAQACG